MTADEIIALLALEPHPEGGHFRETFRDRTIAGAAGLSGRSASTAIYYLLRAGERSHWHRVDAVEVWHWYAGAPLQLRIAETDGSAPHTFILGPNLAAGARPQIVVPAHAWQDAESVGDYTLVGCTVAPGFEFAGFELASKDWEPGR